jgi:arginine:ornithine antiporter/lysine permease
MKAIVGPWGAVVLNIGVIISILGAWVAWTIMTSEVPSSAAFHGVFPKVFCKHNKHEAPVFALTLTSIIMQLTLIFAALEKNAFLAIISISGSMILIPYVLSTMYLVKISFKNDALHITKKLAIQITGIIASVYAFWLLYAAGLKYILLSSILYSIGIFVYRKAWKENNKSGKLFNPMEKIIAIALLILAAVSIVWLLSGITFVDMAAHWLILKIDE